MVYCCRLATPADSLRLPRETLRPHYRLLADYATPRSGCHGYDTSIFTIVIFII